jgi:hypothetical protein
LTLRPFGFFIANARILQIHKLEVSMAKYCDTVLLEKAWTQWLFVKQSSCLDELRTTGLLFSAPVDGIKYVHCVASTEPFRFESLNGSVDAATINRALQSALRPPDPSSADELQKNSYIIDLPETEAWECLVTMIYRMCEGIALKFHPASDDDKNELVHEAFAHTLSKIRRGKLRFTPGRAPVFNLLTTSIIRIMCSIKNKDKRERDHQVKLLEQIIQGEALPNFRSIEVSKNAASGGEYRNNDT